MAWEKDIISDVRLLLLSVLLLCCVSFAACSTFITGEKKVDPKTGETTYESSPMVELSTAIGSILGVGGLAGAVARIGARAARARDAIMDANKEAIEKADWSQVNSTESFKILLKTAQASHDDSKLIKQNYDAWKKKRAKQDKKNQAKQIINS